MAPGDTRRPTFLLQELVGDVAAQSTVYIPEGERDVLSLRAIGLAATCNVGGAGKGAYELPQYLAVADVVLLPDNDPPSREHVEALTAALHGVARRVRVLTLPDLPAKGDVTDWLAAGGTAEALAELAAEAPTWQEPASVPLREAGTQTDRPADACGQSG